jgi:threonine dehydratase
MHPTTIVSSLQFNSIMGAEIILASETFQVTGSFKFRAAYHLASSVPNRRFITASSGNFGQALACACNMLGKECVVVMPRKASEVKIGGVRFYGGVVDLINTDDPDRNDYITRAQELESLRSGNPGAYVCNAYDDPYIIDGNSTLGVELALLKPLPDVIVVPVGGGGLSAGIILGLRKAGVIIPVIGAEPYFANDASRSLLEDKIVANESEPFTIADGARTLSLGKLNFEILRNGGMHSIIEVREEDISLATRHLARFANLWAEPTGALSVAAVRTQKETFSGKRVCCVVSGGNVDLTVFRQIIGG